MTKAAPRSRRALALLLVIVAVGLALAIRWQRERPAGDAVEIVGPTMGTSFRVLVDADVDGTERVRLVAVIEERLERVERLMSTYDTSSELSRFNRHRGTQAFSASRELVEVVAMALEVAERSGGAFDPTVGPLVEAWGFGPSSGVGVGAVAQPSADELARLRARVGYQLVSAGAAASTLTKSNPDVALDLSGIAKGHAAESVAEALAALGYGRVLVEVGGELYASGRRRDRRPWRVGIERPDDAAPGIVGSLELSSEGTATSGDYRDYYELDGALYAHIVDPRTGRPLPVRAASVTVVHERAALADAWATALAVLGPEEGFELARREGLAALFVHPEGGELRTLTTPALGARFSPL